MAAAREFPLGPLRLSTYSRCFRRAGGKGTGLEISVFVTGRDRLARRGDGAKPCYIGQAASQALNRG